VSTQPQLMARVFGGPAMIILFVVEIEASPVPTAFTFRPGKNGLCVTARFR